MKRAKAFLKKRLAAFLSLDSLKLKSMVFPSESTADINNPLSFYFNIGFIDSP